MDNPYQPPNTESAKSIVARHRSFRLTPNSMSPDASVTIGTFRDAIVFATVQQVPLLLLSAMLLDGGLVFMRVVNASAAFWSMTLMMWLRRGRNLQHVDLLAVKWGYFPLLLATCFLWLAFSRVLVH